MERDETKASSQFPNHWYTELETIYVYYVAFGEINHGEGDPGCGLRIHSSGGQRSGQVGSVGLEGRGEGGRGKRILTIWGISDPSSCPKQNSSNQAIGERPSLPATWK